MQGLQNHGCMCVQRCTGHKRAPRSASCGRWRPEGRLRDGDSGRGSFPAAKSPRRSPRAVTKASCTSRGVRRSGGHVAPSGAVGASSTQETCLHRQPGVPGPAPAPPSSPPPDHAALPPVCSLPPALAPPRGPCCSAVGAAESCRGRSVPACASAVAPETLVFVVVCHQHFGEETQ